MFQNLKIRLYDILVETEDDEVIDRVVATFLMILILLNAVIVILEFEINKSSPETEKEKPAAPKRSPRRNKSARQASNA